MSSNSFVVDLTKSLVIVDPNEFPMNLEKTVREDYPAEMPGILPYEARNVVPTALGYRSFFNEAKKLSVSPLPAHTQHVMAWQNPSMGTALVALGEYGIKIAYPTITAAADWETAVDTSATEVAGVRRLWTTTVIAGRLYLYQAGADGFYCLMAEDDYLDASTNPSLIAGASRTGVWTNWQLGLIKYVPTFLNMAGQLGLFRAKNRLGFWDSANSVAWSSAVAIEDFEPSIETLAGITQFADVQGSIIKVLGSGEGFIIYASRSVVLCSPLDNSPERWSGRAILNDIGIAFDAHAVAAQPDLVQFCITQAGLLRISQGQPEYIFPEVADLLARDSQTLALHIIEGRYLFVSSAADQPVGFFDANVELINDFDGNAFTLPATVVNSSGTIEQYIANALTGMDDTLKATFGDFTLATPADTDPSSFVEAKKNVLQPCYDVKYFDSSWVGDTYVQDLQGSATYWSQLAPTYTTIDNYEVAPVVFQPPSYDVIDGLFDKTMEEMPEYFDALGLAIKDHFDLQTNWRNDFAIPTPVYKEFTSTVLPDTTAGLYKEIVELELDSTDFQQQLQYENMVLDYNGCDFHLYFDRYTTMRVAHMFNGHEKYDCQLVLNVIPKQDAMTISEGPATGAILCPAMTEVLYCVAPITAELWAEYTGLLTAAGLSVPAESAMYGQISNTSSARSGYILWLSMFASNLVKVYRMDHTEADETISHKNEIINYLASLGISRLNIMLPDYGGFQMSIATGFDSHIYMPTYGGYWGCHGLMAGWEAFSAILDQGILAWNQDPANMYNLNQAAYPNIVNATSGQASSMYTQWQAAGLTAPAPPGKYILEGTLRHDITMIPEGTGNRKITYLRLYLSGWGHTPSGGFSFRKTHIRHFSTSCDIPGPVSGFTAPDLAEVGDLLDRQKDILLTASPGNPDPYVAGVAWDYPQTIPFPDNYALFNIGSPALYYPIYKSAAVYDLLLKKWGIYNNHHRGLYGLLPVNRSDNTVVPLPDRGMLAGALSELFECTMFEPNNPDSYILYGKFGFYRRGISFATEARLHFGQPAFGNVVIEASMDGLTIDPTLSIAASLTGQRNLMFNFTRRAKWFTIRVVGDFNLTYMELLAEKRGRR